MERKPEFIKTETGSWMIMTPDEELIIDVLLTENHGFMVTVRAPSLGTKLDMDADLSKDWRVDIRGKMIERQDPRRFDVV